MKIETQALEDHQVKLIVEFDTETLEQAKRRAARKIAQRTKIPGFRPGKAPFNIVQRHVGDEMLVEESIEILVNEQYPQILKDAEVQPYGPGKLDNIASLDPLTLEFIVPLSASVELADYRSIRRPYEQPSVPQEEIDSVLLNLRNRTAIEEKVDRPAEEGDRIYLKLSAVRQDEDNQTAPLIPERNHTIVIARKAEDRSSEWPFPGFSRELIGMSSLDHRKLIYTFPEDSDYPTLRGATAEFDVTVEDVHARRLPEPNDEFARSVGEYENLESLLKDIQETLQRQAVQAYNEEYDNQVISQIVEQSTFHYPPQMLDDELDAVIDNMKHRLENQGLDLETYKKTRGIDDQGLREEAKPVAETRLKRSLVFYEVAKLEDIQVDPQAVEQESTRTLESMASYMTQDQMRKLTRDREAVSNMVGNIAAELRVEKTLERLRAIASGQEDAEVPVEGATGETPVPRAAKAAKSRRKVQAKTAANLPGAEAASELEANAEPTEAEPN